MREEIDAGVLRLRDWAGLNCHPIYIYDRVFPVAGRMWEGERESHNAAWLMRAGSARVSAGRQGETARAGEWLVPPRSWHRSEFAADAEILSVRFHAQWPDGRPLINPARGMVLGREESRGLTRLAERLERFTARNFVKADMGLEWKRADAMQYLALNRHFSAWLEELVRLMAEAGCQPTTPMHGDERALRAAHVLNTLPLTKEWDMEWLARQAGLSVAQLSRLFAGAFETTPKAYHLERRKRAARQLLEEGVPIKQVAAAVGFPSACYFTAWFRTQCGLPPGKWTEERRNEERRRGGRRK